MNRLLSRIRHGIQTQRFGVAMVYAASFLLPVAVLFFVYLMRGLAMGADKLLLFSPLTDEYLSLIRLLKSPGTIFAFFSNASVSSATATSVFAASPLNWLLALFPLASASDAVALLSLLRAGLCGLTFSVYLRSRGKCSEISAVAFSMMYALCSYAIVMAYSLTYIDTLILFPLLMLGVECLAWKGRVSLFAAALALSVLTNPLAVFPLVLFSAVYAVYCSLMKERAPHGKLYTAVYFISATIISLIASSVTLLPVISSVRADLGAYSFTQTLDILDFIAKALPSAYDGAKDAHLPYLYVGVLPLILIPCYFCSKRIPRRERIVTGALWFVLYITFSVNAINGIWSFFYAGIPAYAHAFIFVFLFLCAASRAFEVLERRDERVLLISSGIFTVLLSLIQKLDLSYTVQIGDTKQQISYTSEITLLWVSLLFTVVYAAVLIVLTQHRSVAPPRQSRRLLATALLVSVSLELLVASSELMKALHKDEKFATENEFSAYVRAVEAGTALLADSPLYRMEMTDKRTEADPLLFRYPSLSDYDTDVLAALGITVSEDGILCDCSAPLMLSLFGLRYMVVRETIKTKGEGNLILKDHATPLSDAFSDRYLLIGEQAQDGKEDEHPRVYENKSALPLLFSASSLVADARFSQTATPFESANTIFSALTGNDGFFPYLPAQFTENSQVSSSVSVEGYTVYERNSGNYLQYTVTAVTDGPLYFSLFTLYPRQATIVTPNGSSQLFDGAEDKTLGTVYLGEYQAGETVRVSLSFGSSSDRYFYVPNDSVLFWQENTAVVNDKLSELSSHAPTALSLKNGVLSAKVNAAEGELLFTTLPSDGAWTVTVDGKRCKPISVMGCMLAIPLGDAGVHTVTFSREIRHSLFPVLLSVSGMAILAAATVSESIASRKRFSAAEQQGEKEEAST